LSFLCLFWCLCFFGLKRLKEVGYTVTNTSTVERESIVALDFLGLNHARNKPIGFDLNSRSNSSGFDLNSRNNPIGFDLNSRSNSSGFDLNSRSPTACQVLIFHCSKIFTWMHLGQNLQISILRRNTLGYFILKSTAVRNDILIKLKIL